MSGSDGDVKRQVIETAKEVDLEAKQFSAAGSLSGGQKRKLSVGIALIGGSKVGFQFLCLNFILLTID